MYEYPPSVYVYKDKVEDMTDDELKAEFVRVYRAKHKHWYHKTYLRIEARKRGLMAEFRKYFGE